MFFVDRIRMHSILSIVAASLIVAAMFYTSIMDRADRRAERDQMRDMLREVHELSDRMTALENRPVTTYDISEGTFKVNGLRKHKDD